MSASFSIFNWRILIFKSGLPANAKYIGCYLSTWMNEWGDNCYPSIARISHETGLSKPTVIKYVHVLQAEGWLEAQKKGFDGQAWAHNQYYPNIPEKAVKEVNHQQEGGKPALPRRLNSEQKAVKEVNTKSTDNSTVKSTNNITKKKTPIPDDFTLTQEMVNYATSKGMTNYNDIVEFTDGFVDSCKAHGYKYVDFRAAWQTWLRKRVKENGERVGKSKPLSAVEQVERANRGH